VAKSKADTIKVSTFDDDEALTPESALGALAGMGTLALNIPRNVIAKPLPILSVYPDPTQPRRAMPSAVRKTWDRNPATIPSALTSWMALAEEESGTPFPLDDLLKTPGDDTQWDEAEDEEYSPERHPDQGPVEWSLLKLARLASSIFHQGLTYPITAVGKQDTYIIETGERRWLAYHLLYAYTQDNVWANIPTRIMDKRSPWRQAEENSARENLNAIAKARQLALLLMDILDPDATAFVSYDSAVGDKVSERAYYAQVADGETYRIPRGKSELIMRAMGLSDPSQLRHHRALLRLPDEVWTTADDNNLPESALRPLVGSDLSEEAQLARLQEIIQARQSVEDTVSTDTLTSSGVTSTSGKRRKGGNSSVNLEWFETQWARLDKRFHKADMDLKRRIVDEMEARLEALKKTLES